MVRWDSESGFTSETSAAFIGSFAKSTTGPYPAEKELSSIDNQVCRIENLTSDVEDRLIIARNHG